MRYKLDWEEMECFKGIDLFDSFVLSWQVTGDSLIILLEASVWPASEHYSEPKSDEYTCYKNFNLEFRGTESISGLKDMSEVTPLEDPDGSKDYGNIEYLVKYANRFELHGEFGEVSIESGELRFDVVNDNKPRSNQGISP